MPRSCALVLLFAVSCSTAPQQAATTPPATTVATSSTGVTYAANSPVGVAEAFMGYVQSRDCDAALAASDDFMWGGALTPDQAREGCPAVLAAVPAIGAFHLGDVMLRTDVASDLSVPSDSFTMDLMGLADASIFFDVTYVDGTSELWVITLRDGGPEGWVVVNMAS